MGDVKTRDEPEATMTGDGPTRWTAEVLEAAGDELPFDDRSDFDDVVRGHIADLPDDGRISDVDGGVVWDLGAYRWVHGECPDTVHPSLHRQTRLLATGGLFEVCDGIYQVRSADLANMTLIEGEEGVIVVDPLTSPVTASAALELYRAHRGERPVTSVVITHSHVDHFGGVRGVVTDEMVGDGVQIVVPAGFTEAAISENVLAGNVMTRRASYMYGMLLPKGPTGMVSPGLGLGIPLATPSFMMPTVEIADPVETMTIDGVEFTFMLAPDTEAPAEMLFHLPAHRALCAAEDATHTLHNLYTLRGARTRDAKSWSYYVNRAIELFGSGTDVVFAQHHWPTWGNERVIDFLESQRDAYKYLHDQTLRMANKGMTMLEIAEEMEFPGELGRAWCNRGYYGSLSHNAKAVYNFYLGWFDGNPSTLHQLPPEPASVRYVDYMGGADAVVERARADFDAGEYRWVAQVLNHVVFADPSNRAARDLLADALTQLGYQTENGVWRNFYLTGAQELRTGVVDLGPRPLASPDTLAAMPITMVLDLLAMRLDGPRATGLHLRLNVVIGPTGGTDGSVAGPSDPQGPGTASVEEHLIELNRSVLNHHPDRSDPRAPTLRITADDFKAAVAGAVDMDSLLGDHRAVVDGDEAVVRELFGLLDAFGLWFNIIEP